MKHFCKSDTGCYYGIKCCGSTTRLQHGARKKAIHRLERRTLKQQLEEEIYFGSGIYLVAGFHFTQQDS